MPEFHLDTSGKAYRSISETSMEAVRWADLDSFAQGYVEALFFTSSDELADNAREDAARADDTIDLDDQPEAWRDAYRHGFSDLAPEALALILKDCERFEAAPLGRDAFFEGAPRSDIAVRHWLKQRGTERAAGAALWAYRNGDKDAFFNTSPRIISIDVLPKLEALAKTFPPLTVTLGDDGKVYLS